MKMTGPRAPSRKMLLKTIRRCLLLLEVEVILGDGVVAPAAVRERRKVIRAGKRVYLRATGQEILA